jgi:hypothetical protein
MAAEMLDSAIEPVELDTLRAMIFAVGSDADGADVVGRRRDDPGDMCAVSAAGCADIGVRVVVAVAEVPAVAVVDVAVVVVVDVVGTDLTCSPRSVKPDRGG